MPRICGIELKSSEAIFAILEAKENSSIAFVDLEPRKIQIGNDESVAEIQKFFTEIQNFLRENQIETVIIKKRAKKGKLAGGAVSFKMEALIQLNGIAKVVLVSSQGIAASHKRTPFPIPEKMKKYQESAFMAACFYLR